MRNFRKDRICFMASLCLFLSALELAIPKPLPFMRLGLANLPIIVGLKIFSFQELASLVLLKILMQAFLSGTLFTYIFIFSAAGSFVSLIFMYGIYRLSQKYNLVSNIGISLAGSLGSCLAQIVCAIFILFGKNTKYIAPVLLVSGMITGLLLGIFCNSFEQKSMWLEIFCGKDCDSSCNGVISTDFMHSKCSVVNEVEKLRGNLTVKKVCSGFVFLSVTLVLLFAEYLPVSNGSALCVKWICVFVLLVFAEIMRHGTVKLVPSLVICFSVTLFSLFVPHGKVLFSIGSWNITQGALEVGLRKSSVLVGMVFASQCFMAKGKSILNVSRTFSRIMEWNGLLGKEKIRFTKKGFMEAIDKRLCETWSSGSCN